MLILPKLNIFNHDIFNTAYAQYYSYIEFLTSKGTMEIDRVGIKTMMGINRAVILQHVHHTHNHASVAGLQKIIIMLINFPST